MSALHLAKSTPLAIGGAADFMGLPIGLMYDRFGPRAALGMGAGLMCVGWLIYGLTFSGIVLPPSVFVFSVATSIVALACLHVRGAVQ